MLNTPLSPQPCSSSPIKCRSGSADSVVLPVPDKPKKIATLRSEEHTSELQSRSDLVCRLLIETAPPDIYTLHLRDALPISSSPIKCRSGSADSVVLPVPYKPKKIATL